MKKKKNIMKKLSKAKVISDDVFKKKTKKTKNE